MTPERFHKRFPDVHPDDLHIVCGTSHGGQWRIPHPQDSNRCVTQGDVLKLSAWIRKLEALTSGETQVKS